MEEVKNEKFGSRTSILKSVFIENNIDFISNIWVITCRSAINNDSSTRYLVCIEVEDGELEYEDLLNRISQSVPIISVKFIEEKKRIIIKNLKTETTADVSYNGFKQRIIEITKCKYVDSFALGSKESTPLSRFFRENMGKGFALTDIDFYLTKRKVFIEEKNFVVGDDGYIGIGQCISFQEIINDIFNDLELKIICIDSDYFYIADFKNIDCYNSRIIRGWGKMVGFKIEKTSKIDLINYLR